MKQEGMLNKEEKHIINQVCKGDIKTFEMLFRKYYEALCRHAMKFIQDPDASEEIVQDLFYAIWEKRSQLRNITSLNSYLYVSVRNRCLKYIRHRNVESSYQEYYISHQSEKETTPEDITHIKEMEQIMNHTLDALPKRCSMIFRMNRFGGKKYQEIANMLSISVKTVEANMGKALKILHRNLKDYTETT